MIILNGFGAVTPTFTTTELPPGNDRTEGTVDDMQLMVCYRAAIVEAANKEEKG